MCAGDYGADRAELEAQERQIMEERRDRLADYTPAQPPVDGPFLGRPGVTARGYQCCGKPQGCGIQTELCAYLKHPYKRWARGEITLEELNALTARGDDGTA